MTTTYDTPIQLVYSALWGYVEDHPWFPSLVKPGNCVRFDTDSRVGSKEQIQAADAPELALLLSSATVAVRGTSNGTELAQQFGWMLTTGDLRLNVGLLPAQWMLVEAMAAAQAGIGALRWRGQPFAKRLAIAAVNAGYEMDKQNRNLRGWSASVNVQVEMHLPTTLLMP